MPNGSFGPFWLSCKVVVENSFLLVVATAMVRVGTIAVRTASTGLLRSTLRAMLAS